VAERVIVVLWPITQEAIAKDITAAVSAIARVPSAVLVAEVKRGGR
jgi:hypothetical protein